MATRNCGTSFGWIEPEEINENDRVVFLSNAFEYYAAARFTVYVRCIGVCGNITHHSVEMFLKGGLARYRTLSELRAMGHNLKNRSDGRCLRRLRPSVAKSRPKRSSIPFKLVEAGD